MVSFDNFQVLNPEAADVARELLKQADLPQSPFMSFISLWMAFNGWMEAITEADSDSSMIAALARNRRVIDAYDRLLENFAEFRQRVVAFSQNWPVLNVKDVRRKLGRDAFSRIPRDDLVEECLRENVKMQPIGWTNGDFPTWAQLLRTIYAVRCNLFHGAKSPQNYHDRELVQQAEEILRMFIERTHCFNWLDDPHRLSSRVL